MGPSRSLEGVPGDLAGQKRMWVIQRTAWVLSVLVLLAGLAGAFGSGPLSSSKISSTDGMAVLEYERFWRADAPMALRLRFTAPGEDEEARVSLSRRYLENGSIERMLPEPDRVELSSEHLTFVYPARGGGELQVVFYVEFDEPGVHEGRVAVGGSRLAFRQLIYP